MNATSLKRNDVDGHLQETGWQRRGYKNSKIFLDGQCEGNSSGTKDCW